MSYYKPTGRVKYIRCKFCGARLRRDVVGQLCPTENCQWQHGLPPEDDTPTRPARLLKSVLTLKRGLIANGLTKDF